MNVIASRNKLMALSVGVVAVVSVAIVLVVIATIQRFEQSEPIVAWSTVNMLRVVLFIAGLIAIPAGFLLMASRPAEGAALVVGGSLTAGLMWWWLIVPILLAVAVSIFGVERARRLAHTAS